MWGGDDPDDRKPLLWPDLTYDKETRANFQAGPKTYDDVEFNQAHFEFYRKLVSLRAVHPGLREGGFTFQTEDDKHLSYSRDTQVESILVAFNLASEPWEISIDGQYVDLLTNKSGKPGKVKVPAMGAVVLKRMSRRDPRGMPKPLPRGIFG